VIVSEAYVRIATTLSDREKREIGTVILRIAESAGQEFFAKYDAVVLGEAVIEDGSSKVRGRIITSATVLFGLVGGYGAVRAGIDYLRHDGQVAAAWMSQHVQSALPGDPQVRRNRTPGTTSIRRLFERVEAGELSAEEASERAGELMRAYGEQPDTTQTVVDQLRKEFKAIRPTTPRKRQFPPHGVQVDRPPLPFRAGKRLKVFRDPHTGDIRYVEE